MHRDDRDPLVRPVANQLHRLRDERIAHPRERAGLVENARQRGIQLREQVAALGSTLVEGCRGEGLLIGVALTAPVAPAVVAAAQQHGLIVNAANDSTIRLAPALTIGDVEIDEFTRLFSRALATVQDALLLDAQTPTSEVPA
ncbi:MAG: aminotransferase class III-fold pyridoxal phosphate-dependent enzyme [Microbacterium sp.]|nr:aminotransferase class III-fold pyridoxal phosphate-dependent enzyme [Microbacterium sp.]